MADNYYSLQEVMEKLNRTEDQVKELVTEGKLREFRDGSNVVYKTEEVDMLTTDTDQLDIPADASAIELIPGETGGTEISLDASSSDASSVVEPAQEEPEEKPAEPDAADSAPEFNLADLTGVDLNLGDLTGGDLNLGELTKADTNITTAGINVLAETDDGYKLAEDTEAETKIIEGTEELSSIGDDLSLDTAGSGSGLLDLSLQADDTSLGAVLDDILPAAGEEPSPEIASGPEPEAIFEPADQELPMGGQVSVTARYAQAAPDAGSNACGIAMFLPLLAIVYAAIVLVAAGQDVVPVILTSVQGLIWYIAIGLAVGTLGIIGLAAMMGGKSGKVAKPKKEKKPKKKKAKAGK